MYKLKLASSNPAITSTFRSIGQTGCVTNSDESSDQEEINNFAEWCTEQSTAQRQRNQGDDCWFFFFWEREKEAKTHTAVCVRGSRWNVRGSWSPHITTLEEKQKKLYYLRKVFIIRPDSSRPRTGSSASGWLKLPRWSLVHIWRASVTTRKWGVCTEPKEKTLKHKTLHSHSPFTLLPSDQRYRSIHCRTTRRLLSYISAHPKQFLCKIKKGQLSLCNPRIHLNREYTIPATIVVLLIIAGLSFALS